MEITFDISPVIVNMKFKITYNMVEINKNDNCNTTNSILDIQIAQPNDNKATRNHGKHSWKDKVQQKEPFTIKT